MEHPERWAISESLPNDPNGKVRSLCHIAYSEHGLVGIDISSHQGSNTDTIRALVEGNERQDAGCTQARPCNLPHDVWWPSGGLMFQLGPSPSLHADCFETDCGRKHWPSGVSLQCKANATLPRDSLHQALTYVCSPRVQELRHSCVACVGPGQRHTRNRHFTFRLSVHPRNRG